jgi:membrane-bound metal-dependent hydrolase YbcI (DUF457 family)
LKKSFGYFGLNQNFSLSSIILGSVVGVVSHIILDSFLYSEMNPFFPIEGNIFFGLLSPTSVYVLCIVCFVISVPIYYKLKK